MKRILYTLICSTALLAMTGCGSKAETYEYNAEDISAQLADADEKYEKEDYRAGLELYTDAMLMDIKNIDARIGAVKCEIAMEQYDVASRDLDMAIKVDPYAQELYDLYFDMSEKKNDISIALKAVSYAERYGIEDVLSRIPKEPELSAQSGSFDGGFELTIKSDKDIYYSLENSTYNCRTQVIKYDHPIYIADGSTKVSAYSVDEGIPSKEVKAAFDVKESGEAVFKDPLMEKLVRLTLDKASGTITRKELYALTEIDVDSFRKDNDYSYDDSDKYMLTSLEDLKLMPFLERIDIYNQEKITDLSPLSYCQYLDYFYYSNGKLKSVKDISDYAAGLRDLYIPNNGLESLEGIEKLGNIYHLDISRNKISDLKPLERLPNLSYVSVDADVVGSDLLKVSDTLTGISIYGFDFDRDIVTGFNNLSDLSINQSEYDDWSKRPRLSNLSFLEKMPQLSYLYINSVSDKNELEPLKKLTGLKELRIYNSEALDEPGVLESLQKALPGCRIYH